MEGDALNLVSKYLQNYQTDDGICNMVLLTVASLTDSGRFYTYYDIQLLSEQLQQILCFLSLSLRISSDLLILN